MSMGIELKFGSVMTIFIFINYGYVMLHNVSIPLPPGWWQVHPVILSGCGSQSGECRYLTIMSTALGHSGDLVLQYCYMIGQFMTGFK